MTRKALKKPKKREKGEEEPKLPKRKIDREPEDIELDAEEEDIVGAEVEEVGLEIKKESDPE